MPLHPDEKLVFLHIPKCAGTSFHTVLKSNFTPDEICPLYSDVVTRANPDDLQQYRYFCGHFSKFGVDCIPGPKRVVTVLREPRDRIVSLYHFWRSHRAEYVMAENLEGPRLARSMDLLSFLTTAERFVVHNINNALVRTLIGPNLMAGNRGFCLDDPAFAVETAVLNLKRFNFVAFAETLQDDVDEFAKMFGLDFGGTVPRANAFDTLTDEKRIEKVAREEMTPAIGAELNRLTTLDRELYERAVHLRRTLRCPYPM